MSTVTHPMNDDPSGVLSRHHQHLNHLFDELTRAFARGDRAQMQHLWSRFETELLGHFDFEETEVVPHFASAAPAEAAALVREHASIRAKVAELGVGLDLHLTRADVVAALVDQLKHHAAREDAMLYRWMDATMDHGLAASIGGTAPALRGGAWIGGFAVKLLRKSDAPRTIVYIEDDPTGIAFMQHVLADFDRVELLTAPTTDIGVEIARARRADVVIIDLPTSGVSAVRAMNRLREWPETREIPVIGLSSPARLGDEAGLAGTGMCRCLQKPVRVEELVQTLESYLTARPRPAMP